MELGKKLKEAREEKQLSLQDIQDMTKIQRRYLDAIEKGNFRVMPGNFYVRAFIREYAIAVGLNPDELLEEFKNELPSTREEDEQAQLSRVKKHRRTSEPSGKPSAFLSFLPRIMVVLLIVGIIATVWYFYQSKTDPDNVNQPEDDPNQVQINRQNDDTADHTNNQSSDTPSEPDDMEEENKQEEERPEPPEPELVLIEENTTGSTPRATYELRNADELILNLEVTGECYIGLQNDKGKTYLGRIVTTDDSPQTFDLTGEKRIELNIGYAPALSLTVNDLAFEYPFDPNKRGNEHQKITIIVKETAE
ncbi:MAG: helix-turn-helix domain-containing protein [Bacillaceae bacterium]|nr:helix-turn-helix domain-containing protein [Bacillaceae bacterium]